MKNYFWCLIILFFIFSNAFAVEPIFSSEKYGVFSNSTRAINCTQILSDSSVSYKANSTYFVFSLLDGRGYFKCSNYNSIPFSAVSCPSGYHLNPNFVVTPNAIQSDAVIDTLCISAPASPVCDPPDYLDTTTNTCVAPSCLGEQTIDPVTHWCQNPICDSTQYLDTQSYTCETNPTCVGGQTVNLNAHPRICDIPQCLADEYLTSDFYCAKISSKCGADNPYDSTLNRCKKLVCEGGQQIQGGQCVAPICPDGTTYILGAKRCGYAFPPLTQYNYIDGVSYKMIQYPTGAYRFRFSIPAIPGEPLAETTPLGVPVKSGKMGIVTKPYNGDGHYEQDALWYGAIAKVPAFGKQIEFKVLGRISNESIIEKLTYLTVLANLKDELTISLDSTNPYSLDVLYAMGYGVDKLLRVFIEDAEANPAAISVVIAACRINPRACMSTISAAAIKFCQANPRFCDAGKKALKCGLDIATDSQGVCDCIFDYVNGGVGCFGKEETPPPPPQEEPPCTNDDVISICPGTQAKATSMGKYGALGYHESSIGFSAPCDGSDSRYYGIAKFDDQGREFSKVCIGPLACDSIPNPNKCTDSPTPQPTDPMGADGIKSKPPTDIKDDVKKCFEDGTCKPDPKEVADMGGGDASGGGDKPFAPGKKGDPVDLRKPSDPVDLSKIGDNPAEPLKDKLVLDDKTTYQPDGKTVQTKETVDNRCQENICDCVPTKQTTTTSSGGVTTTEKQTPDMPPVDPLDFDIPDIGSGSDNGGGSSQPSLTQCDKYPDTLGCMTPGIAPEPDEISQESKEFDFKYKSEPSHDVCPEKILEPVEIDFTPICDAFIRAKPIIIAGAYLNAAYIVFGILL